MNMIYESDSDEDFFQAVHEMDKMKSEPSKEMLAAMKVVNDALERSNTNEHIKLKCISAVEIIQNEWFQISSLKNANPLTVEDYLDVFEELSANILEFIVNLTDSIGNTAMHYAVSYSNFDIVSILLDSKVCDINVPNKASYTCIMLTTLSNISCNTHYDVIRRLFSVADLNKKSSKFGHTTLMVAASLGKMDVAKLLLESGADINIQDNDGNTALMCAAEHGQEEIVDLFLCHPDIDLNLKDNEGCTALKIALKSGRKEIAVSIYTKHISVQSISSPVQNSDPRMYNSVIAHSSFTDIEKTKLLSAPSSP